MNATIRPASTSDAAGILAIYNLYVLEAMCTFETEAVQALEMAQRISENSALSLPWLVAELSGRVVGFSYASKWKGRCAYRYSVESTVYVDPGHKGMGLGRQLYSALIEAIRACGMHAAIGGIALPNAASVGLHERLGFKKVAHFEQVGFKFDRWIDVGYWQLLLQA